MKEFRFSYFTVNNTVTIDEHIINVKTGPFIKKQISLLSLQHFYLFDNKDYRSIFLLYTDEKGRSKKIQLMATPAEPGFNELLSELHLRFPAKGLNHLSEAEAFKVMKAANPKKWAPIAAFLIIMLVMAGFLYPGLRHYFDFGFSKVNVTQLVAGDYDSRNVSISGVLLDKSMEETTTTRKNGSTTKTVSEYIPMVDEHWQEGDPVNVILSFDKLSTLEYINLFDAKAHLGVVRNIAWEGLDKSQADFFKDQYGLKIADDAILVEITNETHNDAWSLYALLLVMIILGIVFLIVAAKQRSKK
jgi:hypothetical protein